MLEVVGSGVISLWLSWVGLSPAQITLSPVQDSPWMVFPTEADPTAQTMLQQYLQQLADRGLDVNQQGLWLQAGPLLLSSNQAQNPLPAASLTKVATSLVALHTWNLNHQFETVLSTNGPIHQGVLQGDLIVRGGGDPVVVWEEGFAIGHALAQLGITKITGNLIVSGKFLMNFETDVIKAGEQFKQALNGQNWGDDVEAAYQTFEQQYQPHHDRSQRPSIDVMGMVQVRDVGSQPGWGETPLLRHRSLPLVHILKLMNVHSNNAIAQALAEMVGGHHVVANRAAQLANVPPTEIRLVNGSGLGPENQLSPQAVCALFAAIQRDLQSNGLTIADLFPISGQDIGTLEDRHVPTAAVVKTGTLNDVSALAGVVPTRDRGLVWFTIINRGTDILDLRAQQDKLLRTIVRQWGQASAPLGAIAPTLPEVSPAITAPVRTQLVAQPAIVPDRGG